MSPQTKTADPLVTALRSLPQSTPDLKDAAQLYELILPILRDADLRAVPIELSEQQARGRFVRGIPLLRDEPLALDPDAVRDLLLRLARSLDKLRKEARPIRDAIEKNRIEIGALLPGVFADDRQYVDAKSSELKLDSALVWTLVQNAVKPAFRAWAHQLSPIAELPDTEIPGGKLSGRWDRGNCFVCGALAALGELQGNDQARHLRCVRCGADWEFRRIACVYCGNTNPQTLTKLYSENSSQRMHLQVCDVCKGYLKVIGAFSPNSPEMLTVHDLATLPLDFVAQKNGYSRNPILAAT